MKTSTPQRLRLRWLPAVLGLTAMAPTACIDYENATGPTSLSVQLLAPAELSDCNLAGKTVSLRSVSEEHTVSITTNADGLAHTSELTPDIYNIATSWSLSRDLTVSGSLGQQLIDQSRKLELPLRLSTTSQWLIGKVYLAGAKDKNNVNYVNGSYIELFNQSDDTLDVAGLYVGLLEAGSTMAYTLEQLHEQHADSVVLLKQIFRIPPTKPRLVAPGGTVVLCNSAIDHSLYSDMEHSLLDADFEAKDLKKRVTNNPDVPALQATYLQTTTTLSNINLTRGGPAGVVIFQTTDDVSQWPLTYKYPNTETKGAQWVLLPKRLILDAVDILKYKNTGTDVKTKRLYTDIDAGFITLSSANGLDGEVIYRKTSAQPGARGQKRLVDTNNSTNDFKTSKTIKPREYDDYE